MNKVLTPILGIESSASSCGIAVFYDDKKNTQVMHRETRKHASKIIALTDQALSNFAIGLPDIKAIAVSIGPGSFTGLRIGLSAAKGMCAGAQKPLITVPTFEAGALQLSTLLPAGETLWVTAKVNTTEYFVAKFLMKGGSYESLEPVAVKTHDEMLSSLSLADIVAGDSNWFNAAKYVNFDGASPVFVAQWARDFGTEIAPESIDYIEPEYYKEFIIKRKSE
jgi:tRNA threonylcarbamoyladenosine biosynthesis protein TsaB